ncbi:MAG: PRC-barrel domain-containing protein [Candidatus Magasanikbacteria bacterium]|nr:PRC-barrel domain-containing protein [Candidatus Magasanikbacteria bacterium]
MQITLRNLLGLPVVTESGVKIGKVVDATLDCEAHAINAYLVRVGFFAGGEKLIKPNQVKQILADRLIVYDASLAEPGTRSSVVKNLASQSALGGAASMAEEK